ncbi:Uncharacterised protein [Citrobacter amalonaticus]|jgi:hypothetical protein|uniref:hypothetical protein n=1 Tax=Enterobacteriaceae TaxID=543 RepID=UPI00062C0B48|nr:MULTISPECIES: hypothetical protein [Enterobacteriaceae]KKY80359.1 hypothetical protein OA46_20640 [Enterobacter cloacae]UBI23071.1 hypothetical protein LA348_23115 [Citrobacter amalonaticus]WNN83744.1 hypothetical protein RKT74_23335 [Leclercia pneumoniae]STA63045.1 Uncharacterised protein [Citrobacter amalonaticus]BCU50902.1 hypothetical protein CIAM_44230 [Citrobacter amalonaticus]
MHTRNVNVRTAAQESSRKIGGKSIFLAALAMPVTRRIARATDKARFHAAMAEEAHAHYGEPFTPLDLCRNLIEGFVQGLKNNRNKR